MRAVIAVLTFLWTTSADSHCFRVWRYPHPQPGCGIYARTSSPDDKTWFVEITKLPPLDDDDGRAAAVELLKEKLR